MSIALGTQGTALAGSKAESFYFYMALCCVAVAFLGFAPTYWLPFANGTFSAHPIVHIHGLTFFAWTIFFAYQTWLATSGRVVRHRRVGMIGVVFATVMTIFGTLVAINQMRSAVAKGVPEAGLSFSIVPLSSIALFTILVASAVANTRRPEWHKRLMLIAAISILDAPVARWFLVLMAPADAVGPPPVAVDLGPAVVVLGLIAIAMAYDWRSRGTSAFCLPGVGHRVRRD